MNQNDRLANEEADAIRQLQDGTDHALGIACLHSRQIAYHDAMAKQWFWVSYVFLVVAMVTTVVGGLYLFMGEKHSGTVYSVLAGLSIIAFLSCWAAEAWHAEKADNYRAKSDDYNERFNYSSRG